MEFNTSGREIVFSALFGSHNYNLNTETSDKDYKVFVLPTFDDLYTGKHFSTSHVGDTDYDVHDIRKISDLFWKTNINFVEVLFSKEVIPNKKYNAFNLFLFQNRDRIVRMNLPYLFNACIGMHYEKMKRVDGKGTESTKWMIEKYGYELKESCHAYRVLDFLCRFAHSQFMDFEGAIQYDSKDSYFLKNLKSGAYSRHEFLVAVERKLEITMLLKELYNIHAPDVEMKDRIDSEIYELVKWSLHEH